MVDIKLDTASLKQKIRILCVKNNLTLTQVAEQIGISQPTLSAKLNGKSEFTANQIVGLANLLSVTPNDLLENSNDSESVDA